MKTAEALSRKLETLGDLRDVTRTMKALSSSSVRQYEHAVDALADYYRTVELGLQVVLRHLPAAPSMPRSSPRPEHMTAVVFGTDYGLCGRFNHVLCDHAVAHLDAGGLPPEKRLLLAVGGKAAGCLEQAGQSVQECLFTPGRTSTRRSRKPVPSTGGCARNSSPPRSWTWSPATRRSRAARAATLLSPC